MCCIINDCPNEPESIDRGVGAVLFYLFVHFLDGIKGANLFEISAPERLIISNLVLVVLPFSKVFKGTKYLNI